MRLKRMLCMCTCMALFVSAIAAHTAFAGGDNYAKAWEDLLGARWNGYIQIRASYNDNGKHATHGYHRFVRKAGPQLDTGRLWTKHAWSPKDTQVYSRQDSVWDSPIWGDDFTTKYYYDFFYW